LIYAGTEVCVVSRERVAFEEEAADRLRYTVIYEKRYID
jgi:hypothetical protein